MAQEKNTAICVVLLIVGLLVGYGARYYTVQSNEDALQGTIDSLTGINNILEKSYNDAVNELSEEKLNKDVFFNKIEIMPGGENSPYNFKVTMKLVMTFNSSYDTAETAIKYVRDGGTITIYDKAMTIHEDMIPEDKWFKIVPMRSYTYSYYP